jgi:hypothetical protein
MGAATAHDDGRPHVADRIAGFVRQSQILLEDPSGNPVELFEPSVPEARLSPSS